ncbi:MAG TPA: alpha-amylase family glycosyl hydrolase [Geobacteraceae bacterium]
MLNYFLFEIQIRLHMWERLRLSETVPGETSVRVPDIVMARRIAERLNRLPDRSGPPAGPGEMHLFGMLMRIFRYLLSRYTEEIHPRSLEQALDDGGFPLSSASLEGAALRFAELFPGAEIIGGKTTATDFISGDGAEGTIRKGIVREMFLLSLAMENQAIAPFVEVLDDAELAATSAYRAVAAAVDRWLASAPPLPPFGVPLSELLRAPLKASPSSLAGQVEYIREHWGEILPSWLVADLLTALDIAREEWRRFHGGPGRPMVMEFLKGRFGYEYPEFERYSADSDWMPNVVMIAKMVYVWLGQLAKKYGREVARLDQVPDEELDRLAGWGFTALWLIGLWERSPASARIKQISGNPEAAPSAYSLYDYVIAHDLGGAEALENLKGRCMARGIRLASDMVPNHTGIYSRWTVEHPDWFIQLDYPPYPAYSFNGPDLSFSSEISLHVEDGYWDKRDAAVVFKHYDHRNGRTRFIYHGNDGTSTPWNDTAQLNYLLPEVREAVIRTILHVAHQFPIIRFDAAMTLAKKHYQRLWYPQPGHGSGVPSRAEHGMTRDEFDRAFPEEFWREVVDRVAAEAPDTLLLAEAFWLMEGYFVRTLGMHRVYNSAFMNMLKMEENAKYRQTVKNVLEYDPRILRRFVNFMNNPDERTAIEQFGREGKYFGACVLLVTMPGLPMIGHGQIEGFHEKYGMEYRRAYWDEPEDEHLIAGHESLIFPLVRRRRLFSGSENFVFYDFVSGGHVDENVFAYSNGAGGEHGVILYNNRYGETAGWIRLSTAIAARNEKGDTVLVRKTLGEALGLASAEGCYYSFRDYSNGLEYLRPARELGEQGLYAELKGYEYRAFLDFREIRDDGFGSWGTLCARLGGRGAPSLAEELKQVRHGAVIDGFRATAQLAARILAEEGEPAGLRAQLEAFYSELNRHTVCEGDVSALTDRVLHELAALQGLQGVEEARGAESVLTTAGNVVRFFLAGWLVFHAAGRLAGVEEYPQVSAAWLSELGLDRAFREGVREMPAGAGEAGEKEGISLLLRPLLRWQNIFDGWERESAAARILLLFSDSSAREYLGVHEYAGHEWCAKERFEALLGWLLFAETLALAGAGNADSGEKIDALAREVHWLRAVAGEAGYRVDRFVEMLRE